MTILLVVIYISFISLGLPDAILGSAWPQMFAELNVPISYAGFISMVISGGTVVSSLMSARLIHRFGTGCITLVSVSMTAMSLLLFSLTKNFYLLCLIALPLGLGAGAIDSALNNFVALHYQARHMSWLHCFWGVGASIGPMLMSMFMAAPGGWAMGYRTIGVMQMLLAAALLIVLPLWKKYAPPAKMDDASKGALLSAKALLKLPGARQSMASFYIYCSIEALVMLWGATFLVKTRGLSEEMAASLIAVNIVGITLGRLVSGFVSIKLPDRKMIQLGQGICALGAVLLFALRGGVLPAVGLFLVGFGCAPIFPSLLHETPLNFGSAHSQQMMGLQMACAYVGTTLSPPILGFLFSVASYELLPLVLLMLSALSFFMVNSLNRAVDKAHA